MRRHPQGLETNDVLIDQKDNQNDNRSSTSNVGQLLEARQHLLMVMSLNPEYDDDSDHDLCRVHELLSRTTGFQVAPIATNALGVDSGLPSEQDTMISRIPKPCQSFRTELLNRIDRFGSPCLRVRPLLMKRCLLRRPLYSIRLPVRLPFIE